MTDIASSHAPGAAGAAPPGRIPDDMADAERGVVLAGTPVGQSLTTTAGLVQPNSLADPGESLGIHGNRVQFIGNRSGPGRLGELSSEQEGHDQQTSRKPDPPSSHTRPVLMTVGAIQANRQRRLRLGCGNPAIGGCVTSARAQKAGVRLSPGESV